MNASKSNRREFPSEFSYDVRMGLRNNRGDFESLVRSCLSANQDPEAKAIEQEWEEIRDAIEEPWSGIPER
jgi:hypothetical protein